MNIFTQIINSVLYLIDFILHIDHHLVDLSNSYGPWMYLILFVIIFCETGLVVTPFLPGDSLLFAAGSLTALGAFDLIPMGMILTLAAIVGDSVNYAIGFKIGPKIFERPDSRWLKKAHLEKTQKFYAKHGGKTIILARFMPIVRTFAPFVAGIGRMNYRHFILYNIAGGILWVWSFLLLGAFFGNLPVVKKNFTLVIFAIIFISILPGVIEVWRNRKR